jgi:mRNA interferase RelE/StbE
MPANVAKIIIGKITAYADDPTGLANNVIKLQGREAYRLRVGDWRVIFEEDEAAVHVVTVAPRSSAYD